MAIPRRYRDEIVELGDGHIVVTCSPMERALWLYPLDNWQTLEQTILGLPSLNTTVQKLRKFLIGHAHDCEIDGSGRILDILPENIHQRTPLVVGSEVEMAEFRRTVSAE